MLNTEFNINGKHNQYLISRLKHKKIKDKSFTINHGIKKVNLASNSISHLASNKFEGLYEIEEIDLSNNRLKSLDKFVFKNLNRTNNNKNRIFKLIKQDRISNLHYLDLKNNLIESIEKNTFTSLINLVNLNLKGNCIENLDSNVFYGLVNLKFLDISFNRLRHLEVNLLNDLLNLKEIDLSRNELESISSNTFKDLKNLISINLSGI